MAYLTKEQILKAKDRKCEDVEVPEWGGTVRVMGLSGEARDQYEEQVYEVMPDGDAKMNRQNMRALLCSLTIVDENDLPLFSHKDVKALGTKSANALDRVFMAAM